MQKSAVPDVLQTIARHSDDVFWAFTGDFDDLLYVNGSYEDVFGTPIEDLRKDPSALLDGVHPTDEGRVAAAMDRVSNGEPVDIEFRVDPDMEYRRWIWVQGTPVFDDRDMVEKVVGIAKDITTRKHREEERELFQRMIDESNSLIFVNEANTGKLVYANQTACEKLGYTKAELLEKHVHEIETAFEDPAAWEDHIDNIREQGRLRFEGQQIRSDGTTIPVEVNLSYVDLGSEYVVAIARDISDQLERERELKRHNKRLERLTSVASHDLRNPLNVADGRIELAREDCDSVHLDEAATAIERMESLIHDLLTLARGGQPIESMSDHSLSTLAEESWNSVNTKDASLNIETEKRVEGNESRLKQLFENLFSNAIEHGGKEVTVTVGDLSEGFYVADNGPGIPPDKRKDALSYGYTTTECGTGFGLAIVREIAEAHGWEISITESDAGGTRFEIVC